MILWPLMILLTIILFWDLQFEVWWFCDLWWFYLRLFYFGIYDLRFGDFVTSDDFIYNYFILGFTIWGLVILWPLMILLRIILFWDLRFEVWWFCDLWWFYLRLFILGFTIWGLVILWPLMILFTIILFWDLRFEVWWFCDLWWFYLGLFYFETYELFLTDWFCLWFIRYYVCDLRFIGYCWLILFTIYWILRLRLILCCWLNLFTIYWWQQYDDIWKLWTVCLFWEWKKQCTWRQYWWWRLPVMLVNDVTMLDGSIEQTLNPD